MLVTDVKSRPLDGWLLIIIMIIILVGLSSVSWSRDHIGDAFIDNGIGPSPPKQGAKRVSQEGRVVFVSRAGYPLNSPKVIYGWKRWAFRPERKTGRDEQERR